MNHIFNCPYTETHVYVDNTVGHAEPMSLPTLQEKH